MARPAFWFSFAIAAFVSACAPVQLVSSYDPVTDASAAAMQKSISAFFIMLDTAETPLDASFATNQQFYREQAVNIGAMQLRAQSIPDNALTIEQIQNVEDNLAYLALLHKGCVAGALTDVQKTAVRARGIDASIACRTAYGAAIDAADRGASQLKPVFIPVLAGQFDTSLGAIMRLEIAKKRDKD